MSLAEKEFEKQLYLAMLSEKCQRYEDMKFYLEDMVKLKAEDLSRDERDLLAIAYKNSIASCRQSIRTISAYELKESKKSDSPYIEYIREYKYDLQKCLEKLCNGIIVTIQSYLIPKAETKESETYYYKMIGDYYRYVSENFEEELKKKYSDLCYGAYNKAIEAAKDIDYKNVVKLGLSLNLAVFFYEINEKKDEACSLAKETIDKAKEALKDANEEEEEVKDALAIVNLIQENLDMWNSEE